MPLIKGGERSWGLVVMKGQDNAVAKSGNSTVLLVVSGTNEPNVSRQWHFYAKLLTSGMDRPFSIVIWHI